MHIINVHIDETLDAENIKQLKEELMHVPHVSNVEINKNVPHDLMVEYEEEHGIPMTILDHLAKHGLHTDIEYG